jgi:hypothetical protein
MPLSGMVVFPLLPVRYSKLFFREAPLRRPFPPLGSQAWWSLIALQIAEEASL